MTEFKPPPGTPDGTVCWLYHDPLVGKRQWIALRWYQHGIWSGVYDVSVGRAARYGWRYHSIAEAPADG